MRESNELGETHPPKGRCVWERHGPRIAVMACLGLLGVALGGLPPAAAMDSGSHEIELEALSAAGEVVTEEVSGRIEARVEGQAAASAENALTSASNVVFRAAWGGVSRIRSTLRSI